MMKDLMRKHLPSILSLFFTNGLLLVLMLMTLPYSRLNTLMYFLALALIFILINTFGIFSFESTFQAKKRLKWFAFGGQGFIGALIILAIFYVGQINATINQVIVNPNQSTVIETAFVVYENNQLQSSSDLNGKRLGMLSNSEIVDRNFYVKDEIIKLGLNIEYFEFLSLNEILLALFTGDIEVAALPADYYNQFSDNEGYVEFLDKTRIVHQFKTNLVGQEEAVNLDVTREPFSLLIMGNDGGRTDTLIIATFNPIKLSVTMTSIPRDSFVPIACYPNQQRDKIGHAFSVSRNCAIETVENLFDIDISYYIEVNFKGVVEIVNALDKIWVESPVEFVGQNSDDQRGFFTVWVPKGGFWADGEQALALARERYAMPGGDFQRQTNQQMVISSIIERTLSLRDINQALAVLSASGNNLKTNLTLEQMISMFNLLMNGMNKTGLQPAQILDMQGSRVMTYPSFTYNESLQLPLWIAIPYEGSIRDLRAFMLRNLSNDSTPPGQQRVFFDARLVFWEEDFFNRFYDEAQLHERLPDIMPNMSNNNWTLDRVRVWARERSIPLTVEEIKPGSALYNANVVHNYIVGQSVRYGIRTTNITALTVRVIKHNLDCRLEENQRYEECRYRLPDFEEDENQRFTPVSFVISWFKERSLSPTFKYVLIPETDENYDVKKIGLVIKQEPSEWADVRTLSEITLTVMDPNYSILVPSITNWTLETARSWVKENLETENNLRIVYEPTLNSAQVGRVRTTSPAPGSTIRYQEILRVNVFGQGYELPNFAGMTRAQVESSFCTLNIATCGFVNVVTNDASLVGTVASQVPAAGSLRLLTEWKETTVQIGIYALPSVATP